MANLTVTVPDANVNRVRAAFGHDADGTWVPATVAEVQTVLTRFLRDSVRAYERRLAVEQAEAGLTDAL